MGIKKLEDGTSLLKLAYIDGKPGNLPDKYSGFYTSKKVAEQALRAFVLETIEVAGEYMTTKTKKRLALG